MLIFFFFASLAQCCEEGQGRGSLGMQLGPSHRVRELGAPGLNLYSQELFSRFILC